MNGTIEGKTYKWDHPAEWLDSLIQTRINANDHEGVAELLKAIVNSGKLDGDDIQEIFQSEMDADGYFKPENTVKLYECGGCDHYHPLGWTGDCRDDSQRYADPENYAERHNARVDDIEIVDEETGI